MTRLFLSGDVMTGRGIDQILPFAGDPRIYESYVKDARDYVRLAERLNGGIPCPADFKYIWGDALDVLDWIKPDFRIINLETAITANGEPWWGKGIHYRMHPQNISCLRVAKIDCCCLANNHVLDWRIDGLRDTLACLKTAGLKTAGTGIDLEDARQPAVLDSGQQKSRVLVFSFCLSSSGVPETWGAGEGQPGVNLLPDLSHEAVHCVAGLVNAHRKRADVVVASIHWGGNWGYSIPENHLLFARQLIDSAGVDILHGHSSHHAMGIEHYHDRLIFYGCGDLINDYEGISGYNQYRSYLAPMYFVDLASTGKVTGLTIIPMRMKQFRLQRADGDDVEWLQVILNRESRPLGVHFARRKDNALVLS